MQASIIFICVFAMSTDTIRPSNSLSALFPNPGKCQPHNVQKGQSLSFTSQKYDSVKTVLFDRYVKFNCYVQNYCNISWLKNGSPLELKRLMRLKNDNQTLEIQNAFRSRKGNYTCVASDGINSINRTAALFIAESPYEQPPLALKGDLCIKQTASIGDSAKFFCFFFAGDIIREINMTWYKQTNSAKWLPVSELNLKDTTYEETVDYSVLREYGLSGLQPTAGKHLSINHVTRDAYGTYQLNATSKYGVGSITLALSEPPLTPPLDLTAIVMTSVTMACMLILLVMLAVTWHFYKLDMIIWRKNRFGALENDDGKSYDAFISYADEDLAYVLDIREKLEKAGYSAFVRDIDIVPATTFVEEIILALNTSRRCLIVISPEFIRGRHSALQVDVATDQMLHKQIKIVPIIYSDVSLPEHREAMPPLLKRILTNVSVVKWENNKLDRSMKELLVHMPPHRLALTRLNSRLEEQDLL